MKIWQHDGSNAATKPVPDWWDAIELKEIGGKLIFRSWPMGIERTELIEDAGRLVELAGLFNATDEQIAEALTVLEN